MQQNSNYEQLIKKKINLINDFESGKKQYLKEITERPDTPQFSDRKRNENNHSFILIKEQIEYDIIVDKETFSSFVDVKPYSEQDLTQMMNQLYIFVDSKFWNFCLMLAYTEETWFQQQVIPYDRMAKILGQIFSCVEKFDDQVAQDLEKVINYRSLAHLDRLLFENRLPQFEKVIKMLRSQILNNPHPAFILRESKIKEKPFDSFSKLQAYKSYTPTKSSVSSKGIQRSEMLYNHSKQLQEKARHGQLLKLKQENDEMLSFQKNVKKAGGDQVFQRLFNDSKALQTKQQQQVVNRDVLDKECTFKPEIKGTLMKSDQKMDQIPGFENTIKRMQKAQNEKEYKEKYFEIKQSQLEKVNNNKEIKEFKLSEREENDEPILFLDVRISKNKIGRLGVRKNDDLQQVVKNFARTFALQKTQIDSLQKHIKSALETLNKHQE
ncbi:unnamed protein product (macronuclear) [Paramecium tetraurelia]|uniref:Uncharacterized protein n=1 Tax=Paramecium tetraurelia TaxID=5888 RepID=A0CAK9_PARTE|nr:uncharacterized protein GSPATT00036606001 [Paramecium tetraurelia]CAK67826.1 unnamed protein product [Paramecium tetraurelia]|eukprot:XP_001435223.1 hypothetical protein (macronuclear) [Paramecium tetraurelia strain d4-2]